MPRLFVAIDFPEEIKAMLTSIGFGLPGARWVPEKQYHLTLRFIGEVDGDIAGTIHRELEGITASSFTLQLKGIGFFPPRGNPRVLWVGVEKNDALHHLRNRIEAILVRLGLEPERRKFSPHITLARFKEKIPVKRLGDFLAVNNLFSTPFFDVDSFSLYSSLLTSKGAIHQQEADFPLEAVISSS